MEHDPPGENRIDSFTVGFSCSAVHPRHDSRVHRVLLYPPHRESYLLQVLHRAEALGTLWNGCCPRLLYHFPSR